MSGIASRGIKLIKPLPIDGNNIGTEWTIDKNLDNTNNRINAPTTGSIFENNNGTFSIRFSEYQLQQHQELEDE